MIREHIILAILWILYCALHSYMASMSLKQYFQKRLPGLFRYYRVFYTLFSFAGLAGIVYYHFKIVPNVLFSAPVWIKSCGAFIGTCGLLLMLICIRKYFMSLSGLKSLLQESYDGELMVGGIHRYMRHPLYAGTFAFIWGLFLLVPQLSLLIANTIITVYTLIGIRLEELKLVAAYGEAYKTYKRTVPMLIPSVRRRKINARQ